MTSRGTLKRFKIGRLARCLAIVVFATTMGYRTASAQTIAGQVVDKVTEREIGAGFVILMDGADVEIVRLLTSADGEFEFRGVRPGVYRLKSERIAYRATFSPRFELRRGESQRFRLEIEALPLALASIEVREETACRTRPSEGEATAILWEEIRKALAAATWTASQRGYRYRHLQYERDLDRRARRVTAEQSRERTGFYQAPFRSQDADTLAEEGYVVDHDGEWWFYGPDDKVLQADAFLRTHCFRVVRDRDDYEGMIGLAFEPTPGRRVTDIKGTLWLDERSSELRTLEFRYTNLIHDIDDKRLGGTVEFLQMPNGAWVVYRWELRMPLLGVERRINQRPMERVVVRGYRDVGGEVVNVQTASGETVYSANLAHLSGVVTAYRGKRKLAGARVSLAGTNYSTMTDEAGRFVLTGFIDGEYAVDYSHPWLDSMGFTPQPTPITLRRGESRFLELVVPEPSAILAAVCREVDMEGHERAIVGNVLSDKTGSPIGKAEVTASWRRGLPSQDQLTTSTDSTGHYELCGVPTDERIFVRAQAGTLEGAGAAVTVTFDQDGVWYNRNVCLDVSEADLRRGSAGIQANCFARRELWPTEDLIWRQDFTLGDPDAIKMGLQRVRRET